MAEYDKSTDLVFTSDGTAKVVNLSYLPRSVFMLNKSTHNSQAATGVVKRAWGFSTSANGTAYCVRNANGASTDQSTTITSGGFSFITRDTPTFGAVKTGTVISKANFAKVTITSHGYVTGDTVLLYNTTGMLQVSGAPYSVTYVDADNFTVPVQSSGFATAATAVSAKKVLYPDLYIPFGCVISNITAATDTNYANVLTTVNHSFVVGQKVKFSVPIFVQNGAWGMSEINDVEANITSIGNLDGAGTYTAATSTTTTFNAFQVKVDVQGYTAFAWPTSAQSEVGHNFAMVYPIGDVNFGYSGPAPAHIGIPGAFTANTGYQLIIGIGDGANNVMHANGNIVEVHMEYPTNDLS